MGKKHQYSGEPKFFSKTPKPPQLGDKKYYTIVCQSNRPKQRETQIHPQVVLGLRNLI